MQGFDVHIQTRIEIVIYMFNFLLMKYIFILDGFGCNVQVCKCYCCSAACNMLHVCVYCKLFRMNKYGYMCPLLFIVFKRPESMWSRGGFFKYGRAMDTINFTSCNIRDSITPDCWTMSWFTADLGFFILQIKPLKCYSSGVTQNIHVPSGARQLKTSCRFTAGVKKGTESVEAQTFSFTFLCLDPF